MQVETLDDNVQIAPTSSNDQEIQITIETTRIKVNQIFNSYNDFEQAFNAMKQETIQLFTNTKSDLIDHNQNNPQQRTFQCKKYADAVNAKSKSTGKRPNQGFYGCLCPAKVKIVKVNTGRNKGKYVLKEVNLTHNHHVTKVDYDFHSENHKLDTEDKDAALNMLETGSKPAKVYF